ncbi:hypothetical protein GCM10009530_06840 [Microbispora corallina]|uniref:ATP-binding protein n=1 Tax=Microbispora corallina TaxID=83302 RepID=A0ABQ4FV20_9ACTN|nr:hypothetical protein [Microbispora corallina]GIH38647.1 hypothetical protein Mco01_16470 [Microbispora corallina]
MTVHAEGAGSIAVGGDAINSIFVTGGVNQFFVGQYERLAEAYLSPRALYRELRLDEYTGRDWLVREIDSFLSSNDRGYLLIEAEAGMGKTAFMAWIARERKYVHHFVRLMPDVNDLGVALRNLSAQLIRAWDLRSMAVGGVLGANASRPDFFTEVLYEAADMRDATRPGEPIVIAVDGLNETAALPFQNPLALPSELPDGVYVLATQRTTHLPLVVNTPRRVLRIRPDSPENLGDIRAYLHRMVGAPDLAERLAASGAAPADVVDRLALWCGGVWLVLRYVLAELRTGARSPSELSSLPIGLWQYYARFWRDWQRAHESTWAGVDLPLLVALTAAQEPLTLDLLCEMSRCPDPGRAADLVGDAWRPFLHISGEGTDERYAAFHDSLGEFMAGQVDASALSSAERFFVDRLSVAQREAHRRVAERYLTAWGELPEGLPRLRGDAAAMDDGYGLRHLVHHLVHASEDAVLHSLMALEWPRADAGDEAGPSPASNAWYEVHRARREFAGYALDVQRAWSRAEQVPDKAAAPAAPRTVALELRYALIASSVDSVAGNVPSELLLLLIDHGMLTAAQALELTGEMSDARARAESLSALVPRLTGPAHAEAVREALASVQLVPDGYWRAGELLRLAQVAGPEHHDDLRRIAGGMGRPYERDIAHRGLDALSLPGPVAPVLSGDAHEPRDPAEFLEQYRRRTRRGVATLLIGLDDDPAASGADRHVASSGFVRSPRWRAELLTESARTAPAETREAVLRAALDISLLVGDRQILTTTMGSIAACLAATGAVDMALACASEMPDAEGLARALFAIAAETGEAVRPGLTRRALDVAAALDDPATRGELLRANAAGLVPMAADGSLAPVLADLPGGWRAAVLGAVAVHDEPAQRVRLLADALDIALASPDDGGAVLAGLVAVAPAGLLPAAREAVAAVHDRERHDAAAAALAARLGREGRAEAADEVVGTIRDPYWRMTAEFGAASGLAAAGRADQAAELAARLPSRHWRAEVLASAGRTDSAYAVADGIAEPSGRISALLRIASAAPPGGDRDGLEEARTTLPAITDPVTLGQATIAVALALGRRGRAGDALDLVRMLPDIERENALTRVRPLPGEALAVAVLLARGLPDPVARGRVLASLTGPLVAAGTFDVLDHVRTVLRLLATGARAQLLEVTPGLLPGLLELAGPQGLVDMAAAVTAAYRWWP